MTATRAGRPQGCLVRSSWLLVIAGLSCAYRVDLPTAASVEDAGTSPDGAALGLDSSLDESSPSDRFWSHGSDQCRFLNVFQPQVEMLIALDRSASMQKNAFDSTTRFQAFQQAIDSSIRSHPRIQYGLEQFPSWRDCGTATCCAGPVAVPPAPNHSTDIQNSIGSGCGPGDMGCQAAGIDSPSHLALGLCRDYFAKEGHQGHSSYFVLLVTDRDPTCGGDASPDSSVCSLAVDEVSKLGANLVQTFVLSLNGDGSATGCLEEMASSNATYFTDGAQQFWVASDQPKLRDQLDAIMTAAEAKLCRFSLTPTPSNPDQMVVQINHDHVPRDQGWSFTDTTFSEIVLSGTYCTEVTTTQGDNTPIVLDCPF